LLQQPEQFFRGPPVFELSTFLASAHAMRRSAIQLRPATPVVVEALSTVFTFTGLGCQFCEDLRYG
jgi:hypothetical protein